MPPRKKRGGTRRGGPGRGKRGKMEPSSIETICMEDPSLAEIREPPSESPVTVEEVPVAETQVKNHKNFGKYRYLHDNSNNSGNTKSGESETEDNVIFIIEEQEVNDDNQPELQESPTGSAIVDDVNQHYVQDDLIVYDNSDCVLEQVQFQEMIVEGDRGDDDDVVIEQEEESQKSSETMFEVMCIVEDPIDVDADEDENSASASVPEKSMVSDMEEDVAVAEAEVVEVVSEGCDDVKINEIMEEITVVQPTPEIIVEHAKHEMYISENSQENETYNENDVVDNLCESIAELQSPTYGYTNTTEIIEKIHYTSEIIEKAHDTDEISHAIDIVPQNVDNSGESETPSDNYDNNVKESIDEVEYSTPICSVDSLKQQSETVEAPSAEDTEMETEEALETPAVHPQVTTTSQSPVEYSNELISTQNLQVILSKDDLIQALDKLKDIRLNDDASATIGPEDEPKTTDEKEIEDDLTSASKILKKKGRPRKAQVVISEPAKSTPRKTKAERKQIIPTPVTTPEKLPPEKSDPEDQDRDDGASAFVKALELADKAAQKKIAKQKEAKAKKIDKAKKSKQRSKASKKAAALAAAEKAEEEDENSIRRSSRIKTITNMKRSSKGKGLVKSRSLPDIDNTSDNSNSAFADMDRGNAMSLSQESPTFASPTIESGQDLPSLKPVKVKSRWRRSSELEMNLQPISATSSPTSLHPLSRSSSASLGADSGISVLSEHLPLDATTAPVQRVVDEEQEAQNKVEVERRLKQFIHLKDNQYLTERISCKEAKKMTCDCFLTEDEMGRGEWGCGEDCLNRLLMIECGSLCAVGDRCTNKRFQKGQFAPCEAFNTVKKGLGIRAAANIPYGEFILEYVGEVLDPDKFDKRAADYSQDKNRHYYFMALRADAIIDATQKGNISRFINHSCDPNAETQKWTVNGELRIGFFSNRTILAGEEITFDYQFQRYGKEAQKCYCDASICRGWLGKEPEEEEDDEDDEDDDEEEETADKDLEDKPDVKEKELKKETRGISDESPKKEPKKRLPKKERIKKKPRKEFFEDLDLDAEIESLQTTGLKNQAHTLKLSRLMVRSKEPAQRTKLLRLLRRGEFPCRRLFLDYHGLRLIHGWMTDAQQLAKQDKKMESLRLEILQTIATLPIPNKTMLQDSKVLSTVEKWSVADKTTGNNSPEDSESNSPKDQEEELEKEKSSEIKTEKVAVEDAAKSKDVVEGIVPLIEVTTQEDVEAKTEQFEIKLEQEDIDQQSNVILDDVITIEINEDDEIRHSVGMTDYVSPVVRTSSSANKSLVEELTNMFSDDEDMDISMSEDEDSKVKDVAEEIVSVIAVKIEEEVKQQPLPIAAPTSTASKPTPTQAAVTTKAPPTTDDVHYNIITEIVALAQKLLEEWAGLKVVFRIPKRERIEQMKEHEREANKGGGDGSRGSSDRGSGGSGSRGLSHDDAGSSDRRLDSRYRHLQGKVGYHVVSREGYGKSGSKDDDRMSSRKDERCLYIDPLQRGNLLYPQTSSHPPSSRITKMERRKQFTLRLEQEESERRRRQRELWRQHEQHCLMMGTDPRFTAPYDPARGAGYHCIWNPATGQWQNYTTTTAAPTVAYVGMQVQPQLAMVLPPLPYQEKVVEMEEVAKVKFMGPIPPPVQLPPKWKCAKDKYGRPYYYHIRIRKAQWEPPHVNGDPTPAEESSSTTSSSDTSSLSSSSSEEDSETDDETSDTKLLIEIRNKFNRMDAQKRMEQEKQQHLEILKAEKLAQSKILADVKLKAEPSTPPTPINTEEDCLDEAMLTEDVDILSTASTNWEATEEGSSEPVEGEQQPSTSAVAIEISSLDKRLKDELGFVKDSVGVVEETPAKKKRPGLVQEYIISPRSEKDKLQFREDLKKYKQNKEMLRKQKEAILEKSKQRKSSSSKSKHKLKKTVKLKLKEITDVNSEAAKKIKESFRSAMATVMVSILNSYRKPDCQLGRITNTEDFKHLARKLTHFVMLKELKHCKHIEDLICTDSVKSKAKEFVRKYMSKFGEVYIKPKDDLETYM